MCFHSAILWHSKILLGDILVIYFALYIFPTLDIGQQPLDEVDHECSESDCDVWEHEFEYYRTHTYTF